MHVWQDRLLPLTAAVPGRAPPPGLWARIEASLLPAAPPRRAAGAGWWQRLGFWQGLSGLAVAASLLLGVLLLQQLRRDAPAPRFVAVLQVPGGGAAGWVVEMQAGGQLRLVPAGEGAAAEPPPGRAYQFWTKPEGAAGPTSLGLVTAGRTLVLPVSRLPALGERQLFEITLEPAGGSPYDRPSGPILFIGRSVQL